MAKTNIRVVSCFDGNLEASEVFADLIAADLARKKDIVPFRKIEKNLVENGQGSGYNEYGTIGLNTASGLCG